MQSNLVQVAIMAADMACRKILHLWNNPAKIVDFKKEDGDTPVTVIDRESSAAIAAILKEYRPNDSVNDEDGESKEGRTGVIWHVDPFDGTSNYLARLTDSVVGLAAYQNGKPIAAAVGHPFKKEIYYAGKGQLSWKISLEKAGNSSFEPFGEDSEPLGVSGVGVPRSWKERFLLIDSLFNSKTYLPKTIFLSKMSNSANPGGAMNIRAFGSNILYGALVASGQVQVSLTDAVGGFWDIAPTILLVKEAGGDVFDIDGNEPKPGCQVFLATNGQYKEELIKVLQNSYGRYKGFR